MLLLSPLWPFLLYPLPLMVIPLAIALGQVVRGGPVTVMSGGAVVGLGIFWLALPGSFAPNNGQSFLRVVFSALVSGILLIGAWALALAQTFRARHWVWLALHCLAVYCTIITLVFFEGSGYATCLLDPAAFCGQAGPIPLPLFVVASYAAPVVLLVYALSAGARRQPHALPEGLTISRLGAEER